MFCLLLIFRFQFCLSIGCFFFFASVNIIRAICYENPIWFFFSVCFAKYTFLALKTMCNTIFEGIMVPKSNFWDGYHPKSTVKKPEINPINSKQMNVGIYWWEKKKKNGDCRRYRNSSIFHDDCNIRDLYERCDTIYFGSSFVKISLIHLKPIS